MGRKMKVRTSLSFLMISLLLWISACSSTPTRKQEAVMDNPSHHVLRGRDLIEKNRWNEARREMDLALELDPNYSPALAGKALVLANDYTLPAKTDKEKEATLSEANDLLSRSLSKARNPQEEAHAHVMHIRAYAKLKNDKDWLEDAEDHFKSASGIYLKNPNLAVYRSEAHFFMARAYQEAGKLKKAGDQYREVLELNQNYTKQANEEMEQLQKISRAEPGSRSGHRVASLPAITRADMASLLIEELHLPQLYKRNPPPQGNNPYQGPGKEFVPLANRKIDVPVATDIENHTLRVDIEEILKLKVRGLEVTPQHLFYPHKEITRAEFALMLEDILIKVTQDKRLATRFVGESSPWPDVREDAFFYNAARTMVNRGIMTIINKGTGEFGPNNSVPGADALLGIRVMKDELQSFVRRPES